MPAAIAIPLITAGVTAGAQITGSVLNARANNKSAKLQTDAANHAADVQAKAEADALAAQKEEQAYERQQTLAAQQARAPYVNLGNLAASALAGKLGVNWQPPAASVAPGATSPAAPGAPSQSTTTYATPSGPQTLASLYQQAQATTPDPASQAGYGGATPMVKVKAPTGETAMIPRDQLARAVSLGAQQVA